MKLSNHKKVHNLKSGDRQAIKKRTSMYLLSKKILKELEDSIIPIVIGLKAYKGILNQQTIKKQTSEDLRNKKIMK